MMSTMKKSIASQQAIARAIARGEYVVDTHAVAAAILRRGLPSLVLVPAQPFDQPAARVEQDEAAARPDVA